MEIIQQIGSYAGLAAVVGLAILSALYFSQAREVKRLREWAGRAPDRAPVPYQPPSRVVAQPVQQPRPPAPPPPPPAAQPAPAQAAAAGAAPAVATGPVAATPAAARAAEGAAGTEAAKKNTVSPPPPRPAPQVLPPRVAPPGLGGHFAREAQIAKAREEAERADTDAPGGEEEPPETGAVVPENEPEAAHSEEPGQETGEYDVEGEDEDLAEEDDGHAEDDGHDEDEGHDEGAGYDEESDPALAALPDPEDFHEGDDVLPEPASDQQRSLTPPPPPPVTATRPPLPPRPAPPPRAPGPILPPYEQSRPGGGGWESRTISPVKAGLAVGGTVLVVGAAAFGVLQMTGGDDGASPPAKRTNAAAGEEKAPARKAAAGSAVNPRAVTVSVLNGTTIGGLAAKLGDRLEGQGFQLGNVTNNTDQQRAESVVLFAPGAEREAQDVGRRLKIDQREPIDPGSQTRAGDATVVVVAGADLDR